MMNTTSLESLVSQAKELNTKTGLASVQNFNSKSLEISKVTRVLIQSPGSKWEAIRHISLDKIYIPKSAKDETINKARGKKGLKRGHIGKLKISLVENGIDYNKPLMIVARKHQIVDGHVYDYELIAGYHRYTALSESQIDSWLFDEYSFGYDGYSESYAKKILQIRENDHSPELPNQEDDLVNLIGEMIDSKDIDNTEDSISEFLDEHCTHMHHMTKGKIIRRAVSANGSYVDVMTWSITEVKDFTDTKTNYTVAGNKDDKRDKYGWSVLEGYEYEYLTNALRKFKETDKESYYLCHTKAPTDKETLNQKRNKMIGAFFNLEEAIIKAYKFYQKNKRWPWAIEGFLPQDKKNAENTDNVLSLKEVNKKIEQEKKKLNIFN